MEKYYYEVQKTQIQMRHKSWRDSAETEWDSRTNQTVDEVLARFDNEADAIAYFKAHGYDVPGEMRGDGVYSGTAYFIEILEYDVDEDGEEELVCGCGFLERVFPVFPD